MYNKDVIDLIYNLEVASSPQDIINLMSTYFENPIFYENSFSKATYFTQNLNINDDFWNRIIVKKGMQNMTVPINVSHNFISKEYDKKDKPIIINSLCSYGDDVKGYALPIKIHGKTQGILFLTQILKVNDEEKIELFPLFMKIFENKLKSIFERNLINSPALNNLFLRMLDGEYVNPKAILSYFQKTDFIPQKYFYILTLWENPNYPIYVKRELYDLIEYANKFCSNKLIKYKNNFVLIYTSNELKFNVAEEIPFLYKCIEEKNLYAGISTAFTNLNDVSFQYENTIKCVEIGSRISPKESIYYFDDMKHFVLLDAWKMQVGTSSVFVHKDIEILLAYDDEKGKDLFKTLQVYFEQNMDFSATAKILFAHPNTIRYRIQQCINILGYENEKQMPIWDYYLSFKSLELDMRISKDFEIKDEIVFKNIK